MSRHTHADARSERSLPPRHPHHPVGLLYTLLRHGRGLSHEEARRISTAAVGADAPKAA